MVGGWAGLWLGAGALALAGGFNWNCRRRLGGFTGDTLGAVSELGEAWILVGAAVLLAQSPG
jgi:cobalamin synthase